MPTQSLKFDKFPLTFKPITIPINTVIYRAGNYFALNTSDLKFFSDYDITLKYVKETTTLFRKFILQQELYLYDIRFLKWVMFERLLEARDNKDYEVYVPLLDPSVKNKTAVLGKEKLDFNNANHLSFVRAFLFAFGLVSVTQQNNIYLFTNFGKDKPEPFECTGYRYSMLEDDIKASQLLKVNFEGEVHGFISPKLKYSETAVFHNEICIFNPRLALENAIVDVVQVAKINLPPLTFFDLGQVQSGGNGNKEDNVVLRRSKDGNTKMDEDGPTSSPKSQASGGAPNTLNMVVQPFTLSNALVMGTLLKWNATNDTRPIIDLRLFRHLILELAMAHPRILDNLGLEALKNIKTYLNLKCGSDFASYPRMTYPFKMVSDYKLRESLDEQLKKYVNFQIQGYYVQKKDGSIFVNSIGGIYDYDDRYAYVKDWGNPYENAMEAVKIGGKVQPKATQERVKIGSAMRVVYVGPRGGRYIRKNGAFVRLKS